MGVLLHSGHPTAALEAFGMLPEGEESTRALGEYFRAVAAAAANREVLRNARERRDQLDAAVTVAHRELRRLGLIIAMQPATPEPAAAPRLAVAPEPAQMQRKPAGAPEQRRITSAPPLMPVATGLALPGMVYTGATPPQPQAVTAPASAGAVDPDAPVAERVKQAIRAGHRTSGGVAAALGWNTTRAAAELLGMTNRGQLTREQVAGRWVYSAPSALKGAS